MIFLGTGIYLITALYKALSIIFKSCKRGPSKRIPNAFSGELSPFLSQGLVQSPMKVFSVTLLVTYKKLIEEDLVDSTFKRQMIPSSLNPAHPNYQYFY